MEETTAEMEEKEKKRKAQLWTVHRYTEGHCMGDICYGHACLVVFMYTHRNILMNTERKGKNKTKQKNTHTQEQQQNTCHT